MDKRWQLTVTIFSNHGSFSGLEDILYTPHVNPTSDFFGQAVTSAKRTGLQDHAGFILTQTKLACYKASMDMRFFVCDGYMR